jgi:hypothetical protein
MKRLLPFGLGAIALIASVGYADAQRVRVHSNDPIRNEDNARRICPELCARTTDFGHRYDWDSRGLSWELNTCLCAIKH